MEGGREGRKDRLGHKQLLVKRSHMIRELRVRQSCTDHPRPSDLEAGLQGHSSSDTKGSKSSKVTGSSEAKITGFLF